MLKLAIMIILILEVLTLAVDVAIASSESTLREVQASEILAKIQNGEAVEYDHIIVKGNLDLSQLALQKNITSSIRINDSTFEGSVNFNDTILDKPIELLNSNFTKEACFEKATFSDADFSGSTFNDHVDFSWSTFNDHADFEGTSFGWIVDFLGAKFRYVDFERASFGRYACFWDANFRGNADFTRATFSGEVNFLEAVFSGITKFTGTTFSSGPVYFLGTTFSSEPVYFTGATFSYDAQFNGSTFRGYLFGWSEIKNAIICDEATYLGLIKNFKDHGQFNEADDSYYQYRYQYMSGPVDWLGLILCGFGVRLHYVITCSIAIILAFAFLYWKNKSIYKISNSKRALKPKLDDRYLSFSDAIFFSALVFFTLHPPYGWEYSGNWKYWVLLEDVVGGAIIALFIVVLSNIIIR